MANIIHRITDLRGGINNTDEPHAIADNEVVDAVNVDWMQGNLGGKRMGSTAVPIDGSVANYVPPVLGQSVVGGATATTTLNLVLPAVTNDGTGTTYTLLMVYIATNVATAVSSVTYGGVPLTALQIVNAPGAGGRIEGWVLGSPSLAGGTITITTAGACDISAAVEYWQRTGGIAAGAGTVGTSFVPYNNQVAHGACYILDAVTIGVATATTGLYQSVVANQAHGTARLLASYEGGRLPSTLMDWTLSASVGWASITIQINFAPVSAFPLQNYISHTFRHTPTNNISDDELWIITVGGALDRRVGGTWQLGVPGVNQWILIPDLTGFDVSGVSLHGKFFLTAKQSIDGMLVWDGTVLRWAGFPYAPPVPTVTNTGAAGTFGGTRYYRVRFTQQNGAGATIRRSEPSAVTVFAPSGANTGAVVTKGLDGLFATEDYRSIYMNAQTHWELEASLDNVLFYRIATSPVATTSVTDTNTLYTSFTLSELIGAYTSLPSARHAAVDEDRLILAGNRVYPNLDSRVTWTPVGAATGVGNDERIPITTGNYIDLDGLSNGPIQALITGETGNIYAMKLDRLYKLVRTGILTNAYQPYTESHTRGACKNAVCSGQDEDGHPCVYFLDPEVGLCRIGRRGVEQLGENMQTLWKDVFLAHRGTTVWGPQLCWIPEKRQVWSPWQFTEGCRMMVYNAKFKSFSMYDSDVIDNILIRPLMIPNTTTLVLEPVVPIVGSPWLIRFANEYVNDAGFRFAAYWTSKAYLLNGLYKKFGVTAANLFAEATDALMGITLIRNLGVAQRSVSTNLTQTASEVSATHVFRPIDNAYMSECFTVQFKVGDHQLTPGSAALDQQWNLNEVAFKVRDEEEATS